MQSEKDQPRRGRPPFPRELVLAAADALFAAAGAPQTVSMDEIAAAAGVGKGTLFRAFGNRTGLINAIFEARVAPIRDAVQDPASPLGEGSPPLERLTAILGAVLTFKLENRYLMREMETGGTDLNDLSYYAWINELLRELVAAATGNSDPGYTTYAARALLGSLRTDLNDELLAGGGMTVEDLLAAQAQLIARVAAPVTATG